MAYTVSVLSSKSSESTENDYQELLHCLGYIQSTIGIKLEYTRSRESRREGTFQITAFSDASFAPGADAKLMSGHSIYLNENLVAWGGKKQKNMTKSTAAAELIALSVTEDRAMFIKGLVTGLGLVVQSARLLEDNQAVIACCQSKSIAHARKMVDLEMIEIRERLTNGEYTLDYVKSEFNIADLFTEALSPDRFEQMVSMLYGF